MFSMTTNTNNEYFWKKINAKKYIFTDINELFLTRVVAFRHLTSENEEKQQGAKRFLLRTMTQSEQEYDFPAKMDFVRKVTHWENPEVTASRCDEAMAAIVYKIKYKEGESDKILYEISFFIKAENGGYKYSHKFNLIALFEQYCETPTSGNVGIRQIGDAVLHKEAEQVTSFSDPRIAEQLAVLRSMLFSTGGVGIAANQCTQLDKPLKIILCGVDYTNPEHVIKAITRYPTALFPPLMACINPEIISTDQELVAFSEGCLSAQGHFRGSVLRPKTVGVRYQDLQGKYHEVNLSGSDARVMLHELDHILHGKVYIQRIIGELSLSQCQKLSAIISDIFASDIGDVIRINTFLTPVVLFVRSNQSEVTFDEKEVRTIFKNIKKNVLKGLNEELKKQIEHHQLKLASGYKK